MPVAYYVRENKLTVPPSYYCQTTAEETLGYDEISELIHILGKTGPDPICPQAGLLDSLVKV